jgi:hypothetical protein
MTNEWYDLPNAKHIDRVLTHVAVFTDRWLRAAYNMPVDTRVDALNEFRNQMLCSGREQRCSVARAVVTRNLPPDTPHKVAEFARTAITALAADDDCAYMLDTPPTVVRFLAGTGNNAAVLLLPAVIAMYEGES